jgi:putative colanic acid biosysnthesis UDP-glucose lipid carrier transferase
MSDPAYLKNGLHVGLIALAQALSPALFAVLALYIVACAQGEPFNDFLRALAVLSGTLSLLILQIRRNGRPLLMTHPARISLELLARWIGILVLLLAAGYLSGFAEHYPRSMMISWAILVPSLVIPCSVILHVLRRRATLSEQNVRSAVFAGLTPHSRELAKQFHVHPELCTEVLGFFDDRSGDRLGATDEFPVIGGLSGLADYVRENNVQLIFIALPIRHLDRVMSLLDDLQDSTASIYYVPDVFVFDLIQSRAGEIMGQPVVAMCETPFYGYRGILKRITDVFFTVCGLLLVLPVMLLLALLIRLDSPGPVIFKQRRYGLDGHEIVVYKFRSMHVTEDGGELTQATRDDPRVTRMGRFLRKFSLDELPQLFNVLQGRMSLVGPRPHAVAHNEQYRKLIKGYMLRHKVLPGITGLAQVNGCRGETKTLEEMEARVSYDLEYLRKWSPWMDLKILLWTVLRVVHDSKAY